jgi:Zn-finger nucleic acid-binding protein
MSNCPACGAPLTIRPDTEGSQCSFCHKVFFPGQVEETVEVSALSSEAGLACPVCFQPLAKATLAKATLAKTSVLYCTQCHGLLMSMEAVTDVIDELRASVENDAVQTSADRDDLKRVIQCPRCNRRMDAHRYAGPGNVVVDSCDNCSLIWFDRGEVTRIAHAPDEDTLQRTYGF